MLPGIDAQITDILAAAELWAATDDGTTAGGAPAGGPLLVAGREDAHPPCLPHVDEPGGAGCRVCPRPLVALAMTSRRAMHDVCPFGIRMLAFPAPAGSRSSVGVLRIGVPRPDDPDLPDGRAMLGAARSLRRRSSLAAWLAGQRAHEARRLRTVTAALAQAIASGEAFERRYAALARQPRDSDEGADTRGPSISAVAREAHATRIRAAHELHDTAAQSMIGAHRHLDAGGVSLDRGDAAAAREQLETGQAHLLQAIRETRAVLNTLVPPGLEELGPGGALEIYVREHVASEIAVTFGGRLPRCEDWLEHELFAMAVEAIDNAIAHAAPSSLRIDLRATDGRVIITVSDDGTGFDPTAVRADRGETGLTRLPSRAAWLGGQVDVSSQPGTGTTVRISVPIAGPGAPGSVDTGAPAPVDTLAPASGATA